MKVNLIFLCFLLPLLPSHSVAEPCEDISGRWLNELGSEVEIDHTQNGMLRGKYYTAVSVASGRLDGHDIVGALPYNKPGASFAFSVIWSNGSSTTVWTGQCQVCYGKEILETSWLLRSFVDSCKDKWKSTRIGKNIFERKHNSKISHETVKKAPALPSADKCNLQGVWYNDVGSEVILNQTEDGVISGEYRTAVERERGSAGSTHSLVYGSGHFGNPNSTFSLMVVWRSGASVTAWVGQCHVCENGTAVLEMNWLLRTKVETCEDQWKSTMYNANCFTRHEQKPGPRKHLNTHGPNRDGEDAGDARGNSLSLIALYVCFMAFLYVQFLSY